MKKLLMFICAVMLVFGMVGSASAINYTDYTDYTDTEDFDALEGMGGSGSGTYEWTHEPPPLEDFLESPDYYIETAEVEIKASYDAGEGEVELFIEGQRYDNTLIFRGTDEGICDVSGTWSDNSLGFVLTSYRDNLTLNSSTFTLDYEKVDHDHPAHAPEPSTILLMGSGLLGMVGYGRKRFSKKS